MRPVHRRRVSLVLVLAAGVAAGCARTNNNTPRAPSTPSTLEAERRVRYLIASAVSGDPDRHGTSRDHGSAPPVGRHVLGPGGPAARG